MDSKIYLMKPHEKVGTIVRRLSYSTAEDLTDKQWNVLALLFQPTSHTDGRVQPCQKTHAVLNDL